MKKIYLLSLGCPRNLVDSEVLQGLLEKKGFAVQDDPDGADLAIVNTCGFIEDAKKESIDLILQLAGLKKEGKVGRLVVTGCLSQRYPGELMKEVKEIDAVFGSSDFIRIPDMISAILAGKRVREVSPAPDFLYDHLHERKLLTPSHYAYIKIQEGCSNKCSYCVIPELKGPRRSRTIDSVVRETERLRDEYDIKEAVLIGQDTTSFGIDRSGKPELAELLKKVSPVMGEGWVRLLYTHPVHFTDELIGTIASADNICKYIDLPVQHANDKILQEMNRRVTKSETLDLISKIRRNIKDVTLRTSVIVGFPGETEEDFEELIRFLEEVRFERLGAFVYSPEEGTEAVKFDGQVPDEQKRERFDRVMRLQQELSRDNNLKYLDKVFRALVDEEDPSELGLFTGRTMMDAPEVDGVVYVRGKDLKAGEFADIKITGSMEYDLLGETV
ncbi:MAG: 30S ribosomal protein S12 methylthiotransferase RimO [Candidatus Omnitrophota bacterium]